MAISFMGTFETDQLTGASRDQRQMWTLAISAVHSLLMVPCGDVADFLPLLAGGGEQTSRRSAGVSRLSMARSDRRERDAYGGGVQWYGVHRAVVDVTVFAL